MVQALSTPTIKMKQPALIHTGVLIPDGEDTVPGWADVARKLRLLPLSFLASQNLERLGTDNKRSKGRGRPHGSEVLRGRTCVQCTAVIVAPNMLLGTSMFGFW